MATPHLALKRLEPLIGTWTLTGRTLDAGDSDINGRVEIEWMPGGFFQVQRGEIEIPALGLKVYAMEILGYDAESDTFPALVYSNMGSAPSAYTWDVRGDVVTHWTNEAKYTGKLSADGKTLTGGWRATAGPANPGNTYDSIMVHST
jgi:hypothetical protein